MVSAVSACAQKGKMAVGCCRVGPHRPTLRGSNLRIKRTRLLAASSAYSSDDETIRFNQMYLSYLHERIAQVRAMEAMPTQEQADRTKLGRPILPENVLMWNELEADHKLITSWHENAWRQFRVRSELEADW
jgi:hypothetical protein